jgi:hypothetical protein
MGAAVPYVAMMAASWIMSDMQRPDAPVAPKLPPPPQPARMPNLAGLYGATGGTGQAGGQKGPAQTFLAGAAGVDPNALTLNKPTLLGE